MTDNYAKLHLVGPSFLRGDESKEEVYIEDGDLNIRIPYFEEHCIPKDSFCFETDRSALFHVEEKVQSFELKKGSDGYTLNFTTEDNLKHDLLITDHSAIKSIKLKYGWKPVNHL